MKSRHLALSSMALAVSLALAHMSAQAQTAPANEAPKADVQKTDAQKAADASKEAAKSDALQLDRIVVTGTPTGVSKMKSSVSISTLDGEQIQQSGAASAAELLRSVPGVRSESSGGEGNANLTVRGVPISAGGARYVQFQEDGLPVLLFGDIAFGTADQFLRTDYNVERLEVVRGGSASTLATNSPGGIINFISKNGDETGGAVGLGLGLDFRQTRLDFDYGTKLGANMRMHVGGFYREGKGSGRDTSFTSEKGGQIKANFTYEFGAMGYIRASFKALDDNTPTFLPVPVRTVNGQIQQIPGIDPRRAFFITGNFPQDTTRDRNSNLVTSDPKDGLHVKSTAVGLEGSVNLGEGWQLENKFRTADNSGRFIGLFPSDNGNGPNSFTGVLFNTSIDSLDNLFNDLKVTKSFKFDADNKLGLTAGLFYGKQDVAETWYWNRYNIQLQGNNPAILGLAGTAPTTFGGCCVRTWDTEYKSTAPYVATTFATGPFNIDASVRRDKQKASGFTLDDGNSTTGIFVPASRQNLNYSVSKTSYSVGANFAIDRNLSLFARVSDGVAFSADRLLYGNPLNGSVPIAVNEVRQEEVGVKLRAGSFSGFFTVFNARTKESNFEATTQLFTSNKYRARGLEAELGYSAGSFRLQGGMTYTNAKITAANDGTTIGKKPRRQADVVYQIAPSYTFGEFDIGGSIVGTTKSFGDDGNKITLPAFASVNAFANYRFNDKTTLSLGANNLFNKIGYTEIEGDGHAARSINGRTVKLALKYAF
jgi:outer membrane receptor protein involved in Fe transport